MKHARERHGRHRAEVRPRYGRITLFGAAVLVTLTALAGASGLFPSSADESVAATSLTSADGDAAASADQLGDSQLRPGGDGASDEPAADPADSADSADTADSAAPATSRDGVRRVDPDATALPPGSGQGRRIVFSEGRQRVWLVDRDGTVRRTYLASGSVYDNLDPGSYEVFSRSRNAVGVDDSGTMEYFVRFTHGDEGAAIGFHTIPVEDGKPVQTLRQLGTPLSHGCIRQKRSDAIALWEFAPIGTKVVVTA